MVTELGRATRPWVVNPREKEVLFENRFTSLEGLGGWGGLVSSGQCNFYPYIATQGVDGAYAMVLDTQGGSTSLSASAIRRMTRRDATVEWHSRIARSGDNNNFLRYLRFAMDYQNDTARHWFEVQLRHFDEAGAVASPIWQVNTGNASGLNYVDSSVTYEIPHNQEQKLNYTDLTIRFDTQNKKYGPLTINGVTYSLGDNGPAAGPTLSEPETFFRNGMNLLYTVTGRSNNSSADPRLYVGYTAGAVI